MIDLRLADESDDADLRAMLRTNSMPSWVTMSMEREPSFLASLNRFGRECAVVARDGPTPVGMYLCAEHPVHINGQPTNFDLGPCDGSIRLIVTSYLSCATDMRQSASSPEQAIQTPGPASLPKMRRLAGSWKPVGASSPLYVGARRARYPRAASGARQAAWARRCPITAELNRCARFTTGQPCATDASELTERAEATGADFFVQEVEGAVSSCMALWNQQTYKQVVARAYRQPLAAALPLYNLLARLAKRITLPPLNQQTHQSFLPFFAPRTEDASELVPLIRDALAINRSEVLTLGLTLHIQHFPR